MKEELANNIEKIEEEIKTRRKLPKEQKKILRKRMMINIGILITLLIYLFLLYLGEENIETDTFIKILKTLSVVLVIITIILFEIAYKTNKNRIILHSVEVLSITLFTVFLIPAYSMYYRHFYKVLILLAVVYSGYYIIKSYLIRRRIKKQYYKSLSDIKSIVAKR